MSEKTGIKTSVLVGLTEATLAAGRTVVAEAEAGEEVEVILQVDLWTLVGEGIDLQVDMTIAAIEADGMSLPHSNLDDGVNPHCFS